MSKPNAKPKHTAGTWEAGGVEWIESPEVRSQEAADSLVAAILEVGKDGAPDGTTVAVVPE